MRCIVGTHDVLLMTFDTLRLDVATEQLAAGHTPNLARLLGAWEHRHSPASFTYAAHLAFFAGFLPTPAAPGPHPRLFAVRFAGSESTAADTTVFDAPNIVTGFAAAGYHTLCIGGVGFFDPASALGATLVAPFAEVHWSEQFGVTGRDSTRLQVELACQRLQDVADRKVFLFINISALHQPNCHYLPGATADSKATQAAALRYVDGELSPLFEALRRRGPALCVLTSDHGTTYGEDGYHGHRCAHPSVWDVPYAEFILEHRP